MANDTPQPVGQMDGGRWKKTDRVWIPEIDNDYRIRVARIQQELDVEKSAREDGVGNHPAQDETILNEPQLKICGRVFSGILLLNQFLTAELGLALGRARSEFAAGELDTEQVKSNISASIDRTVVEHRRSLHDLRLLDLQRQRELRAFRHEHRLSRGAHYKESMAMVVGVLLGVFVLESLLNGSLFSQIVSNGLVGGAFVAGTISLINIVLGIVAGLWGWRLISHRKPHIRVVGSAITLLCHLFALFWNLFVAHFREVAETMSLQPDFDFDLARLQGATFAHIAEYGLLGLDSLQSWALLLLGILIHFVAAKEGWDDVADRYLDYKAVDRRARDARAAFDDGVADLRQDIREMVEELEAEARAAADRAQSAVETIKSLEDLGHQRLNEVRDSEEEWVAGGTQLLKVYRDVNKAVRDPGTAPAYFEVYPGPEDYRNRAFGSGRAKSKEIDGQTRLAEQSLKELAGLKTLAVKALDKVASAAKEIQRHTTASIQALDLRLEKEISTITRQANLELDKLEAAPVGFSGLTYGGTPNDATA